MTRSKKVLLGAGLLVVVALLAGVALLGTMGRASAAVLPFAAARHLAGTQVACSHVMEQQLELEKDACMRIPSCSWNEYHAQQIREALMNACRALR